MTAISVNNFLVNKIALMAIKARGGIKDSSASSHHMIQKSKSKSIYSAAFWDFCKTFHFFSFSPSVEPDAVRMAARSLRERCGAGATQGEESAGLDKPFRALASVRERGVKATAKGVTVIMRKHYLSLN